MDATAWMVDVMPDSAARHALYWNLAEPIEAVGRGRGGIQPAVVPVEVLVEKAEKVRRS